jgi:hypothetical protein
MKAERFTVCGAMQLVEKDQTKQRSIGCDLLIILSQLFYQSYPSNGHSSIMDICIKYFCNEY